MPYIIATPFYTEAAAAAAAAAPPPPPPPPPPPAATTTITMTTTTTMTMVAYFLEVSHSIYRKHIYTVHKRAHIVKFRCLNLIWLQNT